MNRFRCLQILLASALLLNPLANEAANPPSLLDGLEEKVACELKLINSPATPWVLPEVDDDGQKILDVAIIGSGMAGMTACFALIKQGIVNVKLFDENTSGAEGPWINYARMKVLRSGKSYMGPSLQVPSLSYHSWYEAQFGCEAWNQLKNISTDSWMEYLNWYKKVLNLPVVNHCRLLDIIPDGKLLKLSFIENDMNRIVIARKVVLATGRTGFGGFDIPEFMRDIPKKLYAHTGKNFDISQLKSKRVAVIGAGASAFDAAAVALESGALQVDMIVRRSSLPLVNKFAQFFYPGLLHGFHYLSDEDRCKFAGHAFSNGTPPPKEALRRIENFENFKIRFNTSIDQASCVDRRVLLNTNQGTLSYDFIILGTGYAVDGRMRSEIVSIMDRILLWSDQVSPELLATAPKMGQFPYLGEHFEFREKSPGAAPFLKNIYCFNYGATLSHGLISSDIPGISFGATRLAEGIARDLFLRNVESYYQNLLEYNKPVFNPAEFNFLK